MADTDRYLVQWWNSFIFAVFGAAILIGSPICGWAADRTSNRSITFYTGLLILAAATILFGLAKASWALLISRLCQGLSAAITYTVGLALLVDTVGRDNIGQWMGTALSSSSFGLIVSPLLGGIVYAKAGYMAVFGMAMGLIMFDIVLRLMMIEKKTAAKYIPVKDLTPADGFYGTFTTGRDVGNQQTNSVTPPTESQDERLPSNGQKEPSRKKGRMPTILVLLGIPRLLAAIYAIFVNVSILAAFDGVLPLHVKRLFGWNSLNAGLIFLCLAIPALTGPLVGFTLILIVSPVAADLSTVVEEKEKADPDAFGPGGAYAQAFALFNCSMAAATLFGPVVAGALVERYDWGVMTAAMGIFAFSGAIPAFFYTGGWIFAKET
ncbi:MAG: hypothetical protein LQ352_002942 [Teloschistes flavicans]|nr:MAG: hypothetical protein LQ352_002942 [Teloschistes flavicans]